MAFDEEEEMVKQWSVKQVVLSELIMSLKRILKGNKMRLERARLVGYMCRIQNATKAAFVNHVNQFVNTYSMKTERAKVDGRIVDFSIMNLGRHLKLPILDDITEGQLPALTKKQHENIFEGDYPKESKLWKIEKARQHWRLWLRFVNNYLIFRPHTEMLVENYVMAAIQTWEGKKINWALIVQQKIHEEILRTRVGQSQESGALFRFLHLNLLSRTAKACNMKWTTLFITTSKSIIV